MIELVIDARKTSLGELEVGRVLPFHARRMVGPFIFLDHMGPAVFQPGGGINVRPHPHIGLSTLTYLFEGEVMHRDSLGFTQAIRPGEVNWMTAGAGIVHSERTDPPLRATGGAMNGMQAWIALPDEAEEIDPSFDHHGTGDLPELHEGGLWARLVAGEAYGAKAKVHVHSPLFYIHWELQPGTKAATPPGHDEAAVYVAKGSVEINGRTLNAGQMAVFANGHRPTVTALTPSTVMALGGAAVGPRLIWWNFVSSSQARIDEAKADWVAGRLALPPDDDAEFIPLPEEPLRPAPQVL